MNILAIDRSTDVTSVALATDGEVVGRALEGNAASSAGWTLAVQRFLQEKGLDFRQLDRIAVGIGPGSFAGVRGALSFAQGLSIGIKASRASGQAGPIVYGVSSASAVAAGRCGLTAVAGDARRGLIWIAVYDGLRTVEDLHLVPVGEVYAAVPENAVVATPDGARIGDMLKETFAERFAGNKTPSAEWVARLAAEHPEALVPEPLPIYLSPAVRPIARI